MFDVIVVRILQFIFRKLKNTRKSAKFLELRIIMFGNQSSKSDFWCPNQRTENMIHYIGTSHLSLSDIQTILLEGKKIALSEEAIENIQKCRAYLDDKMERESAPIYGINTGFGSLCDVKIDKENLTLLQENLVMSHSCGTGDRVPQEIVKLMLLLKIQSLSYGHSGVQLVTAERLITMFNEGISPVIYTQGSLGASGDLAPLAHLALPLIGEGTVVYEGE